MSDWQSPCGGRRWRTLPSGLVEVEGEGTPAYAVSSAEFRNLAATWTNWRPFFRAAASRYGIPVSWVVAIAASETGPWSSNPQGQASVVSFDNGVGIMQITNYPGVTPAQMADPRANIDTGAMILGKHAARFGYELPAVAAAYNAGSVYCSPGNNEWNVRTTGDYPRHALMNNNAAILSLGVNESSTLAWMFSGVLVSGVVAGAYLWWAQRRA
jgi:soluble lytic murein transglycosylase-like protein